jgi:hypothetical protein
MPFSGPKLSPRVSVATLRLPRQKFNSPRKWNSANASRTIRGIACPEHRPWEIKAAPGAVYFELSRLRQRMNAASHHEPTGDENFD